MDRATQAKTDSVPYTMSLPNGSTLFVRVPGRYVEHDLSGEIMFTPEGGRFLDRIRALAMQTPEAPSPAYVRAVREAMGLTQPQLAKRLGYSLASVKKWESGAVSPGPKAVTALRALVDRRGRRGIVLAG